MATGNAPLSAPASPAFQGQGWFSFQAETAAALSELDRLSLSADALSLDNPLLLAERLKDCLGLLPRAENLAQAALERLKASAETRAKCETQWQKLWQSAQFGPNPASPSDVQELKTRLSAMIAAASHLQAFLSGAEESWAAQHSQ